jgi:hypothetical protein
LYPPENLNPEYTGKMLSSDFNNIKKMNSLVELKKFYEYKNNLLHATEEFIGYNPLISLPLEFPRTPEFGEQIIKQNFIVGEEMFTSVFSSSLSSGPLSSHKKIEIYRDKQRIIFTKRGGYGYGSLLSLVCFQSKVTLS